MRNIYTYSVDVVFFNSLAQRAITHALSTAALVAN